MKQKSLAKWLKIIVAGIGICGLIVYAFLIPFYGHSILQKYTEYSDAYIPWLIFIWITALPCYAVLVFCWRIASNIGADKSFSHMNASLLEKISYFAAFDTFVFFVGNVVLLFIDMSSLIVMAVSFIIVFIGIAVSVAAAVLSHLVHKAAELQEQSDLTI